MRRERLFDVGAVALAALDVWITTDWDGPDGTVLACVAVLGLLARHRRPVLVLVLTLPALFASNSIIATLIALYTVARQEEDRRLLAGYVLAVAVGYSFPDPYGLFVEADLSAALLSAVYGTMTALAPAFLGQLVRARHDLSLRLSEIERAREHERLLVAEQVLARERAQLAREMHDVVSHQVSLIAVRAGALQVSTSDPDAREAAGTIRGLSVDTLDELRHMVALLRASGSPSTELAPQPTLGDLERLLAGSGIDVSLEGELPADAAPVVQRAIYRTVQEELTNVRKHAPGATTSVRIERDGPDVLVTVANTHATRVSVPLPSARHGLVGLRERAELIGGSVHSGPTTDGGYEIRLRLPFTRS
ncbi:MULTISPECIES: histidine kinase [Actinosynnema]|uniref:sensor histidine kinase n=1 Tax=Actinosynnema TaxID=40566 RepID=UPI0020A3F299|nr:histidine kinase [Actinosynnema pretiosum]MCP2098802.1 Signal transduction histidine kinase [Actinosynnema pretiosum]